MDKKLVVRSSIRSAICVFACLAVLSGCGDGGEESSGTGVNQNPGDAAAGGGTTAPDSIALSAFAVSPGAIDLAWAPPADEESTTRYKISRNGAEIATLENVTAFEDTDLSAATAYTYFVEEMNAAGNPSGRSKEAVATTSPADLTAPAVSSLSTGDGTPVAVNSAITVDFSAPMSKATLNRESFRVDTRGGIAVEGEVSVNGSTATFTPSAEFSADTEHTTTITTSATDAAGNALVADFSTTFVTAAVADTTRPTVSATFPQNAATGVPINTSVSASFSEAMNNSTVTTASFRLRASTGTAVAGTVKVVGTTATFTPTAVLSTNTQYTAVLRTSALDAAGNALAANYKWKFTTGAAGDTIAPAIVSRFPADGSSGVALNTSITATFSEMMKSTTMTTTSFRLVNVASGALVNGTVSYSLPSNSTTLAPSASLAANTKYQATVTSAATDAVGNPMTANVIWTFTTAAAPDVTAPNVTSTLPLNLAMGIALNSSVSATFSELMTNATLTTASVTLARTSDGVPVNGTVSVTGNTVTFAPSVALAGSTQYTATIGATVRDAAGNPLAAAFTWSFTTTAATTTAILAWDPVSAPNLGGYRIYHGTAPGTYLQPKGQGLNVGNGTTYTMTGLVTGTRYYFAVTAFDTMGNESSNSNEVFKDIP